MTGEQCQTCKFWGRSGEGEKMGNCHRYPPQIIVEIRGGGGHMRNGDGYIDEITNNISFDFPVTGQTEWCGEWKAVQWKAGEPFVGKA